MSLRDREYLKESRKPKYASMTPAERRKFGPYEKSVFHMAQTRSVVDKMASKIASMVNKEARGMDIETWDSMSGKMGVHPYKTQMLLEHLIDKLKSMV